MSSWHATKKSLFLSFSRTWKYRTLNMRDIFFYFRICRRRWNVYAPISARLFHGGRSTILYWRNYPGARAPSWRTYCYNIIMLCARIRTTNQLSLMRTKIICN